MEMIKKRNYDASLAKTFARDEFIAWYKDAQTKAYKNYKVTFYQSMATLIGQIGYAVDEILLSPKIAYHTTLGSLKFLCLDILHDKALYNFLIACEINENANKSKHSTNNLLKVEIKDILHYYNNLITRLGKALESKSIAKLMINLKAPKKVNIVEQTRKVENEKFENIGKHKLDIKLDNNFVYDKYNKTVEGKLIIKCDDEDAINELINIYVMNKNGNTIKR